MDKENKIILYKDDDGKVSVNTRFADEDVWLTQAQLAEIYQTTKQNVSQHIDNILSDGELDENRTVKNFLTVREEGKRKVQRDITYYNLDMIIALGYRVQSPIAVRFRRWATQRLHEYIQKGFTMDDERLPEKLQYLHQKLQYFGQVLELIIIIHTPSLQSCQQEPLGHCMRATRFRFLLA
jgi:hypothetical protein